MAEAHRLCHLQVGEAGHHDVDVALGERHQRALQLAQESVDAVDLAAQPQPHVGGDLVVARAAGVQPFAGVTDELRQARLDVEVHVLELELPFEAAGVDLRTDLLHAALDVSAVLCGNHALCAQHLRVRQRGFDVGLCEPAVEADTGGVALRPVRRPARKTAPTRPWTCCRAGSSALRLQSNRECAFDSMVHPAVSSPTDDAAPRTSRPWLDSTRPGHSSGPATSLFDRLADAPRSTVASPFDVCHVGVVLRAVLVDAGGGRGRCRLCRGVAAAMVDAVFDRGRHRVDRHAAVARIGLRAAACVGARLRRRADGRRGRARRGERACRLGVVRVGRRSGIRAAATAAAGGSRRRARRSHRLLAASCAAAPRCRPTRRRDWPSCSRASVRISCSTP